MARKFWYGFGIFMCGSLTLAGFSAAIDSKELRDLVIAIVFLAITALLVYKWPGKRLIPESRAYTPGAPLPIVAPGNMFLASGEVCHARETAKSCKLKTQTVGYSGGGGWVSVRIAKGVTLHSGSRRSAPIKETYLDKSPGVLYITNKRIIMASSTYPFDRKLSAISAITPYTDGFAIHVGSAIHTVLVKEPIYVTNILRAAIAANK